MVNWWILQPFEENSRGNFPGNSQKLPPRSPAACICGKYTGPSWKATPPDKENLVNSSCKDASSWWEKELNAHAFHQIHGSFCLYFLTCLMQSYWKIWGIIVTECRSRKKTISNIDPQAKFHLTISSISYFKTQHWLGHQVSIVLMS